MLGIGLCSNVFNSTLEWVLQECVAEVLRAFFGIVETKVAPKLTKLR